MRGGLINHLSFCFMSDHTWYNQCEKSSNHTKLEEIMKQSQQTDILSQLYSLKANLPEWGDIEEKCVDNFNSILIGLPSDLSSYRIPDKKLTKRKTKTETGFLRMGGETRHYYSDVSYCDRAYFLERIDALIRLLNHVD